MVEVALPEGADRGFLDDVISGLSGRPKSLPSKYFYDHRGSELFEKICDLKEYYLTRAELGLLDDVARDVARLYPEIRQVVEFGSGNCQKVQYLLDRHAGLASYIPIDVSEEFLLHHAARLTDRYTQLDVAPVVGDFLDPGPLETADTVGAQRLGFFPGSTIGNLDRSQAATFMQSVGESLGEGSYFLIGVDTVKSEDILLAAYDDDEGVTSEFNLNLLHRMKSELNARLDIEGFEHEARFNREQSRIEMHLRAIGEQQVQVGDHCFRLKQGETIHTENSHKYRVDDFISLAAETGWESEQVWMAPADMFSVHLLRRQS